MLILSVLAGFTLGNAAYLFVTEPPAGLLPTFYQWMLVLHVVVGTLILAPMAWLVAWHMTRALAMKNPQAVASGVFVTVAAFALLVTGLFIMTAANSVDNRWAFLAHVWLALLAPLGYVGHRLVGRHRPPTKTILIGVAGPLVLFVGSLAVHHVTLPPTPAEPQHFVEVPLAGTDPYKDDFPDHGISGVPQDSPFFPAAARTLSGGHLSADVLTNGDVPPADVVRTEFEKRGFVADARIGSESCARCHADTTEQWARSAHRFASFNNPFYAVSIDSLREADGGFRSSQWCSSCHDPTLMLPGDMLSEIDKGTYQAQAGLTCLACHAMHDVDGLGGNGAYRIADAGPESYLFADAKSGMLQEVHDGLIRSKPDEHKRAMLKPVFRTPEYCATCHKVSVDTPINGYRWLRGQNEYDNHQNSGVSRNSARTFYLPSAGTDCRDCHMPLVAAPLGDMAAKDGVVRSHLFAAANTALPHIRGDQGTVDEIERFLQGRLRIDVFAVKRQGGGYVAAPDLRDVPLAPGEDVELQVVVRNAGVGHTFPGGTVDSNEAWVHLRVQDGDTLFYESGRLDPGSRVVDPEAHKYEAIFVDEEGKEASMRDAHNFRAAVYSKVIGPGTADIVRYALRVPVELAGRRLSVTATLRWRKFRRDYTEFAWKHAMPGRPVPNLPITDLATATVSFPVLAGGERAVPAALAPDVVRKEWVRWNDWGIGLLLQGDTRAAEIAFGALRDHDPERIDGWRNLARTKLADRSVSDALGLLQEAEQRDPGSAQTAYFFGVALDQSSRLEEAIAAFERARDEFPVDRSIHRSLGKLKFRLERYDEALIDFLEVLRIDPEDREAHYYRFLIYSQLGDEKAAAMAQKAYRKFQIDESAQKWTNQYRRDHPIVNRESQSTHLHDLERVDR